MEMVESVGGDKAATNGKVEISAIRIIFCTALGQDAIVLGGSGGRDDPSGSSYVFVIYEGPESGNNKSKKVRRWCWLKELYCS